MLNAHWFRADLMEEGRTGKCGNPARFNGLIAAVGDRTVPFEAQRTSMPTAFTEAAAMRLSLSSSDEPRGGDARWMLTGMQRREWTAETAGEQLHESHRVRALLALEPLFSRAVRGMESGWGQRRAGALTPTAIFERGARVEGVAVGRRQMVPSLL